jgi:endonuclease YncB( thermonuclease family)
MSDGGGCILWSRLCLGVAITLHLLLATPGNAHADRRVVDGLAIVQADGSLRIGGETVRLFGAYFPEYTRTCTTFVRPPRCGNKSVLVLDNLVTGFVRCEIVRQYGSVLEGICTQPGNDLFGEPEDRGAQLILEGWALTTPDAPPNYRQLEALAQSRDAGLWGNKILNLR